MKYLVTYYDGTRHMNSSRVFGTIGEASQFIKEIEQTAKRSFVRIETQANEQPESLRRVNEIAAKLTQRD